MITYECPICQAVIKLDESKKEKHRLTCPACKTKLEIVALTPPVLEEAVDEEEDWE